MINFAYGTFKANEQALGQGLIHSCRCNLQLMMHNITSGSADTI